jgi:hypothetical protein
MICYLRIVAGKAMSLLIEKGTIRCTILGRLRLVVRLSRVRTCKGQTL